MNINPNPESSASQCKLIQQWLLDGHTITQVEAYNLFHCFRLASRIHDLRRRGMNIHAEKIQVESGKVCNEI